MPEIRTITIDELDRLGIDESNGLYWDNKRLLVDQKVYLQKWLNVSIVVGAFSTLVMGLIAVLGFFGYGA